MKKAKKTKKPEQRVLEVLEKILEKLTEIEAKQPYVIHYPQPYPVYPYPQPEPLPNVPYWVTKTTDTTGTSGSTGITYERILDTEEFTKLYGRVNLS